MKKIILINGLARSGKDTTAKIMQEELIKQGYSVKVLAFADKLKDMVCELLGVTREDLDKYKNNPKLYKHMVVKKPDWDIIEYPLTDFRTFLDIFGNKIAKTLGGESVWSDIVLKNIEESNEEYFIISDFRFPIEYSAFENTSFDIITLQVQRDIPKMNLGSEKALDNFVFDYIVDNNSDLDSLEGNVKELLDIILVINKENKEEN